MNQNKESIIYWLDTSLYLNITNKCCNNCVFCVRNYKSGVYGFTLKLTSDPSEEEIILELDKQTITEYKEIVFTGYGEPLERLDIVCNVSKKIRKIAPDIPIRVDTNGLGELLNPEIDVIDSLREAGVTHLSISLNASTAEKYQQICRPRFGKESFLAILSFAEKAKDYFDVLYTVVGIPELDLAACEKIAADQNIPLRVRPYSGPKIVLE